MRVPVSQSNIRLEYHSLECFILMDDLYKFKPGILCRYVIIAVQCLTEAAGRAPIKYRGDRQRCRSI